MNADLGHWEPLSPPQIADLFESCPCRWWIAGGHAIDAFVGVLDRRPHEDVDVGLLTRDQTTMQVFLHSWELHCADPPGHLRPWRTGEVLAEPIHDVWARSHASGPWRFQLLLNPADGDEWVYRRDPRIRLPVDEIVWRRDGIPYLVPEIQLLFKSKTTRPRDEQDFADAVPSLDSRQREWLAEAISLTSSDHPWLRRL